MSKTMEKKPGIKKEKSKEKKRGKSKITCSKIKFRQGYKVMRGIVLYQDKERAEEDPRYHEAVKMLQLIFGSNPDTWTPFDMREGGLKALRKVLWGDLVYNHDEEGVYNKNFSIEDFRIGGSGKPFIDREPLPIGGENKVIQFRPAALKN